MDGGCKLGYGPSTSVTDFVSNRMSESLLCAVQVDFFLLTEAPLAPLKPTKQLFLPPSRLQLSSVPAAGMVASEVYLYPLGLLLSVCPQLL